MVRFPSSARRRPPTAGTGGLHGARRLLRDLLRENLSLVRDLEDLRVVKRNGGQGRVTGWPARLLFDQRLAEELSRFTVGSTGAGSGAGSLLVLEVGDRQETPKTVRIVQHSLLEDVDAVICSALRAWDLCCQIGGDEFLILLPDATVSEARAVMSRIRAAVIRAGSRRNAAIRISIGCASWPSDSRVAGELLAKADRVMLAEKRRMSRNARRAPLRARAELALVK